MSININFDLCGLKELQPLPPAKIDGAGGLSWISLPTDAQGGTVQLYFRDDVPAERLIAIVDAFNDAIEASSFAKSEAA